MCDPGNRSEVMRARAERFARDLTHAPERRRDTLRRMMNLLRSAALAPKQRKGCTPGDRQGGARDAQINQSINQSINHTINPYVITMADGISGIDVTDGLQI